MTPCMTPDEWERWQAANDSLHPVRLRADSPCRDCTPAFAATQRAICTGIPGVWHRGPAYTEDEALAARRATWRAASRRRRAA